MDAPEPVFDDMPNPYPLTEKEEQELDDYNYEQYLRANQEQDNSLENRTKYQVLYEYFKQMLTPNDNMEQHINGASLLSTFSANYLSKAAGRNMTTKQVIELSIFGDRGSAFGDENINKELENEFESFRELMRISEDDS